MSLRSEGKGHGTCISFSGRVILNVVDGEKLRAVLLINPTKSTLLPILNQGEVGPKKPKQTSCIWFNRQPILLQSSPIKLSSQSLSPKLSEPNSIKTLILDS